MSESMNATVTTIGVGLDTGRYGHHATFLKEDRQPATKPLEFLECRSGYQRLERLLAELARRYPNVHFQIRVDAAGQYATNLLHFLHQLPWPKTISVGEPLRNKKYREVHFPKRKADATESHACARFAVVERPAGSQPLPPELLSLQETVSRLQFQVKQSTRHVNRLHNLLARVFPELATLQNDLKAAWVLKLLQKYPTAERIAKAPAASIVAIPHLSETKARQIHQAAGESIGAHRGELVEQLVRHAAQSLQQSLEAQAALERLVVQAFDALPDQRAKRIVTIKGIGKATAAVLVAKIIVIERFPTAADLVGYFGVFPEEATSGVDKWGNPIPAGTMRMSRKGNDLVRKYLWMAAQTALKHNPAIRQLYAQLKSRGRRGDVALGHCMKKLLQQVFGIWTSDRPFDPQYHLSDPSSRQTAEAAGRKAEPSRQRKTVTATPCTIAAGETAINRTSTASALPERPQRKPSDTIHCGSVDFPFLRSQISMERVLRHLGYLDRLRGSGQQRRGPCPVHGSKRSRPRSFSVNLGKNVFQCFHPPCRAAGNTIDLWGAVHQLTPYEAAKHLAQTFQLQLTPTVTEKTEPVTGTRNVKPPTHATNTRTAMRPS